MKLAISNIAWNKEEEKDIVPLLKKYEIPAIEIAPTMIWSEPTKASAQSINQYRKFWNNEGIDIVSTQALLFGHPELKIFEDETTRKKTLLYIEKMIQVCSMLGVQDVIFGSPANRDKGNLQAQTALEIAEEFFYKIGEIAQAHNIYFCIEPIPEEYGTNFINNSNEGMALVKKVNHPYFKLHLDSAALTIANEDYQKAINNSFPYLRHIHISERNLLPIGSTDVDHATIAKVLNDLRFNHWLSIEMRRKENESNREVVEETLKYVTAIYA
jgi:D-psicose/D-tagatose/L-ribulose 3-epimerase